MLVHLLDIVCRWRAPCQALPLPTLTAASTKPFDTREAASASRAMRPHGHVTLLGEGLFLPRGQRLKEPEKEDKSFGRGHAKAMQRIL